MALERMTPEQWAQLGRDLGKLLAARRQAEAYRRLLVQGALRVLEHQAEGR